MPLEFEESDDSPHPTEALSPDQSQPEESLVLGAEDEPIPLVPQQTSIEFKQGDLIGRYEFESVLGKGGFGQVVKAADHRLNRSVAIKFPRLDKFESHALAFLEEARSVARLDHTSIIRVYNVEQTDDGWPFVVMEYVEGPTLSQVIRDGGLTFAKAVHYFIQLAEALAYAHKQTLIHRDIKPANVIISQKDDTAKLADFGMALHDLTPEENLADCPQGTPPYMSPEQLRGENHRLDRRTDIWGFGVLMYTVLTGRKPFKGDELPELVRNICRADPKAPREINESIPTEMERICLRCIEKLMRDRYQQTEELVEDLKAFQKHMSDFDDNTVSSTRILPSDSSTFARQSERQSSWKNKETGERAESETLTGFRVVPKGLRSFDTQDTEFFLELLPGPKDRLGIPDSIRFWMNQLDSDATSPLSVGMIYGPSGCGKSSFVKAGLIPNLDDSIRTIYLEASPENTESELLAKIKEIAPNVVRDETKLPVVLSRIRRGQMMTGEKLLIVLDQFEQWLSVQAELDRQPLVEALRQCDGQNVCCLLLIRDDFWMSASQFMNKLDLRVQEGINALGIPLFDRRHARKVLTGYGRALQALPSHGLPLDSNQKKFVEASVDQMADSDQVVPIHIAMFAQMLDPESWKLSELKRKGGWQGIGIRFLDKIFSDNRLANSETICRELLAKMVPDSDSKIKGAEKSLSQLMPTDANEKSKSRLLRVLDLLDREFRIITPSESDETERHYQLAHDSLVVPIKTWLAQQQAQTWQGRSRARVNPLVSRWNERPENRFLPSLLEFIPIKLGVKTANLTEPERKYLGAATRFYSIRGLVIAVLICAISWMTFHFWNSAIRETAAKDFQSLMRAPAAEVDLRLQMLEGYSAKIRNDLLKTEAKLELGDQGDLYRLFATAHFSPSAAEFPVGNLLDAIHVVENENSQNIIRLLQQHGHGQSLNDKIQYEISRRFESAKTNEEKVRMAIVALHVSDLAIAKAVTQFDHDPTLRETFIEMYGQRRGSMQDVVRVIRKSNDAALVSALLKSVGSLPKSKLSKADSADFVGAAKGSFLQFDSAAVHSAAEWALKKLNAPLPVVDDQNSESWFIDRLSDNEQLTFLRIPVHEVYYGSTPEDGGLPDKIMLKKGFCVSSKEVSARLFSEFLQSNPRRDFSFNFNGMPPYLGVVEWETQTRNNFTNNLTLENANEDIPISQVSWLEAAQFCNWLSIREGRTPRYRFDVNSRTWISDKSANGYRLPTTFEFNAMNRAGSSTRYFFGADAKRLNAYVYAGIADLPFENVEVGIRGNRMPNNFGVFDSTGNVCEWCEIEPNDRNKAFRRGGATVWDAGFFKSARVEQAFLTMREDTGIRLVLDQLGGLENGPAPANRK